MSEMSPINGAIRLTSADAVEPRRLTDQPRSARIAQDADRVEISQEGRELSEARPATESSPEKIARIRQQIAADAYLTDEKLAVTVDRLLAALRTSPAR